MELPSWWPSKKPYQIRDCIEGMSEIPDKSVDLIATDPPYGVGLEYGDTYEDNEENWYNLMDMFIPEARRVSNMVVFPACQFNRWKYYFDNFPPNWMICWYKGSPGTRSFIGFNDWEAIVVYGKNEGVQMHDYFYCQPQAFDNGHPCPKPVGWYEWLISRMTKPGGIVLDPFLGSGTNILACRRTGRIGLGFEINPEYEPIIKKRYMENIPSLDIFEKKEV